MELFGPVRACNGIALSFIITNKDQSAKVLVKVNLKVYYKTKTFLGSNDNKTENRKHSSKTFMFYE
jgi:hypothetical protein